MTPADSGAPGDAYVDGCAVPDHRHRARHHAQQGAQELRHGHGVESALAHLAVEFSGGVDRCNDREMFAGEPLVQGPASGRAARRCAPPQARDGSRSRLQRKCSGLGVWLCLQGRPTLRAPAGAIFASSRWRARRNGRCTLQFMAASKRPTWRGLYATPKETRLGDARLILALSRQKRFYGHGTIHHVDPRDPLAAPIFGQAWQQQRCRLTRRVGSTTTS